MIAYLEKVLLEKKKRLLLVETSSDAQYVLTRKFYDKLGYKKEATIQDFWQEGEDKIIFCKKLNR